MVQAADFMKRHATLIAILALGAVLRLVQLGSIPAGLFGDEASNGYDALSLAQTLRDRTGEFLPLFTRAIGDYREAIASYAAAPFVALFGLSEFTTRLPSALAGLVTIAAVYWLGRELFGEKTALLAALFLAISPWHIFLSRIAFRVVFEVMWVPIAVAALLRARKHPAWIFVSAAAFAAALWTYSGARVFVPLFVAGLALVSRRELLAHRGRTVIAVMIFTIPVVLFGLYWISPEGMARANESPFSLAPVHLAKTFASYYSLDYLFVNGDPTLRHSMRGTGMLNPFEVLTVFLGVLYLLREHGQGKRAMLVWMLLYPVPAIFSVPEHALRSAVGAPMFALLSGLGARRLLELPGFDRRLLRVALGAAIVLAVTVFSARFFFHYSKVTHPWQGGIKTVLRAAEALPDSCLLVTEFYGARELVLFYTQEPPADYQRHLASGPDAYATVGRFRFMPAADVFASGSGCVAIVEKAELRDIGHDAAEVLAEDGEFRLIRLP